MIQVSQVLELKEFQRELGGVRWSSCVPIPADAPTRSLSVASELSSSEKTIVLSPRTPQRR